MVFDDFKNLVMNRQACRNFSLRPVDKDTLSKILDLSRFSPSACNSQPWNIYCVSSPDKLKAVASSLQDNGSNAFTSNAQAFVVITETDATLKAGVSSRFNSNHFVKYDIGELTAYITLTAKSLGVDSCIIGWINQDALRKAVGFPDNEISNIVIALGYGDTPLRTKTRKEFDQIVKFI